MHNRNFSSLVAPRLTSLRWHRATWPLWLVCCWLVGCSSPEVRLPAWARNWTDVSGEVVAQGSLIKVQDGQVHIHVVSGEDVVISIATLSQADRNFIIAHRDQQPDLQANNPPAEQANELAANHAGQADEQAENPFKKIKGPPAPESTASPFERVNPAAAVDRKASGESSMVAVSAQVDGKSRLVPGIVCGEHQGQAYVIVDRYLSNMDGRKGGYVPSSMPQETMARWQSGEKQHQVNLEFVHFDVHESKWVFRAPAKELPSPLSREAVVPVEEQQSVQLISVNATRDADSYSFVRTPSKVTKVFRTASGDFSHFAVEGGNPLRGDWRIVVDDQGRQIGVVMVPQDASKSPPAEYHAVAPQTVDFWERPTSYDTAVYPLSGDKETVRWQVIVEYSDPLKKISQAYLFFQPQPVSAVQIDYHENTAIDTSTDEPFDKDLARIELKPGEPSPESVKYMQASKEMPLGSFLVGEFETKSPGQVLRRLPYKFQMAYTTAKQKELVYLPISRSEFNIHLFREERYALEIPDIPGFDGKQLDVPRAIKTEAGYQITTELTVPDPPLVGTLPPKAPRPDDSRWSILGKPQKNDKYTAWKLNIPSEKTQGQRYKACLMAHSRDHKWLYLTDYDDVLYRLDAETMKVTSSLKLSARPDKIAISSQGVVLYFSMDETPAPHLGLIWQLEADTLKVKRAYQVSDVQSLAASPTSDYCYVGCRPYHGTETTTLGILDLAQGKMLHWIPGQYKHNNITTPLGPPLSNSESIELQVTKDGMRLLIDNRRFLIKGSDLILESYEKKKKYSDFKKFFLNGDGTHLSYGAWGNDSGKRLVSMYVGDDFKQTFQASSNLPAGFIIEVVPAAESLYYVHEWKKRPSSEEDNRLCIYNLAGEKKFDFKIDDLSVKRVMALHHGSRIITKGEKSFTVYDIHPGAVKSK